MSARGKSILFWVLSFLLMGSLAVYQRMTGPTHPARGSVTIEGTTYKFKLLRSYETPENAPVTLNINRLGITGEIAYKRLRTNDEWTTVPMQLNEKGEFIAYLPTQPAAGKLEYMVTVTDSVGRRFDLTEEPVVIRFKGKVPLYILIPHIFCMFFAMFFALRTGIESFTKGPSVKNLTKYTLIFFLLGGIILGPIVQKFAFGAFWTGWPFGHDLTDNKTLIAFLAWIIAYRKVSRDETKQLWVKIAATILILIYLIPHSALGSELDYKSGKVQTGQIK